MKKNFFDLDATGKIFLWMIALPQIFGLLAEIILMVVALITGQTIQQLLQIQPISFAVTMLAQVAILTILLFMRKKYNLKQAIKFQPKIGARNIILCVLIGIIGIFALSPIVDWFGVFLQSVGFNLSTIGFDISSPLMLIVGIIFMALVPAILEEAIFRGAILQGLKRYGKWVAIFATSALFVLVHGSLQQVLYPFIISIILCQVVLKTNSVFSSMIVHFVSNSTSLILAYAGFALALPIWASFLVAIVGVGVMWALSLLLKNTEKPRTQEEVLEMIQNPIPQMNNNPRALKIGVYLAILIFVLSTVLGFMPVE
ncbi:MAG: CPBP family intramembrane metalloprotease [Clostridia bacterium]|nr:CPBP family intramembrane metalloprotease [Clostridia bacterium]MBR2052775.1 CPBP family intramembrane metalloprotease [Clostridia bacterium]MBR2433330.1 CPBP family intramembrane metalloprotease [Clostridia bacterium]